MKKLALKLYTKDPAINIKFTSADLLIRYTVKELLPLDFTKEEFIEQNGLYILTINKETLKFNRISLEEVLRKEEDYFSIVCDYRYLTNGNIEIISMEPFEGRAIIRREE